MEILFCVESTENLKNLNYHTFSKKIFLLFAVKVKMKMKKYLKKEGSIEILKILGLTENI